PRSFRNSARNISSPLLSCLHVLSFWYTVCFCAKLVKASLNDFSNGAHVPVMLLVILLWSLSISWFFHEFTSFPSIKVRARATLWCLSTMVGWLRLRRR